MIILTIILLVIFISAILASILTFLFPCLDPMMKKSLYNSFVSPFKMITSSTINTLQKKLNTIADIILWILTIISVTYSSIFSHLKISGTLIADNVDVSSIYIMAICAIYGITIAMKIISRVSISTLKNNPIGIFIIGLSFFILYSNIPPFSVIPIIFNSPMGFTFTFLANLIGFLFITTMVLYITFRFIIFYLLYIIDKK